MEQLDGKWHNIRTVAALTGLHTNTVRGYVRAGRVESKTIKGKFGNEIWISEESLVRAGIPINGNNGNTMLVVDSACESKKSALVMGAVKGNVMGNGAKYISTELYKEMIFRYEQALVRLGQLENQRLVLTERAESLQEMEERYKEDLKTVETEKSRLEKEIAIKEESAKETAHIKDKLEEKLKEKDTRISMVEDEKRNLSEERQKMGEEVEKIKQEKESLMREVILLNMPWWKKIFINKKKINEEVEKKLNENK